MRSGYSLSFVAAALFIFSFGGCAGVKQGGTGVDGGGNSGGPGTGGGLGSDAHPDIPSIEVGDPTKCGNGMQDPGEQCDDGNMKGGDGCSAICQIPSGWSCTGWPSVCSMAGVCGDGILGATEACDDGNMASGDGCSSDCKTVEPGFECRVPGRPCVPACGDNMIKGGEQCDDGNMTDGDGCSSTCQVEPGAACPKNGSMPAPGKCTPTICGNGVKEGNEGCDCGTNNAPPYPTGCKGPNGLFFGDATGCSKTCTQEPSCRDASGKNQACDAKCGNGNVETGEQCDDGNLDNGDGCSSTCMIESGFMCQSVLQPDTVACTQPGNSGQCLELPIVYRDFKNESVSGGHPDFFYLGAPITGGPNITGVDGQTGAVAFSKRYCVPNSSGPAKKNDSTNRCWDLAQANLGPNGKPVFNMSRTGAGGNPLYCDCQFIDWSHNGNPDTNSGVMHVPGYTQTANGPTNGLTYTNGASGHPMYRGPAPVVSSAANFGTWWVDGTYTNNTHTVGSLEMAQINGGTKYQYSSQVNAVTGGFFPLDPPPWTNYGMATGAPGTTRTSPAPASEAYLCNLWPYWYSATNFGAGYGCKGDQYLFPPSLIAPDTVTFPCPAGANCNGKWYTNLQGWFHDSWFSDEVRYLFTYTGDFSLQFYGDDDMFIFINGILVVDLGGVHQRLPGLVSVTGTTGTATITEGGSLDSGGTTILACPSADPYTGLTMNATANTDGNGHSNCTLPNCDCRTRTVNLNLTMNKTYEIAVFGADRHPTESNYQLTLSGFQTNKTSCMPRCGDGTRTGAEECDCGDASAPAPTDPSCGGMKNMDGVYGGCTTKCQYGPYCGDGIVNGNEQCDNGSRNNNVTYGNMNGCAPGCQFPHFCGDGNVDEAEGEQCDLGMNNGPGKTCTADCKICVDCQ